MTSPLLGLRSSARPVLCVNLSRCAHLERHTRYVTRPMWNPSGRSALPATHTSASEVPGVVDPREESKESKAGVARGSFFRRHFSSLPCSSSKGPQRHHRRIVSLAASEFLTGIVTSTLLTAQKRCATLNKTQPYATKSRKKRR